MTAYFRTATWLVMQPVSRRRLILRWSLALLAVVLAQGAHALDYRLDGQLLPIEEQWVLEQVQAGQEANLQKRFGAPVKLRAAFLEKLLCGGFEKFRIPRTGVQISHAVVEESLDLSFADINHYTRLAHCYFMDAVNLQHSHFSKPLCFDGSRFYGLANFEGMKIDGDILYNDTLFEQEVVWTANLIGGKFYAERAEFRSKTEDVIFNGMKVTSSVFLKGAKFHGAVNFVVASIGRHLLADETEFFNSEKPVDFKNIKVGMSVYLKKARFHGPVTFQSSEINEYFRANEAKFLSRQPTSFAKLKVGQKFFFSLVAICSAVDISYGNFADLEICGSQREENGVLASSIDIPSLNLKGTVVQRELSLVNARISDLDASNLQVKGSAKFSDLEIGAAADFRSSAFQSIDFTNVTWPKPGQGTRIRKVLLGDLTYTSISINKSDQEDYQEKDFRKIMDMVETSPFNTQTYMQLEAFCKRIGRENWANTVFIRMHDRELAENMSWGDPRRWLEWFFWGRIAGYGRAPFRVFFLSLLMILLGALLYNPVHLKAESAVPDDKTYKLIIIRVFLSLDRFLPIELGLAKNWEPKLSNFLIWLYYHLELILGWILIPIALASIYTQIK